MEPTLYPGETSEVRIPIDGGELEGALVVPRDAYGVVLFAHGSGSSRHSQRNQAVALHLQRARVGTLLFDLLTRDEGRKDEGTAELRFDIDLLARRLLTATDWLSRQREARGLRLGYFGASTGAAAALVAAAQRPTLVSAVVSRGGRVDLAGEALSAVRAPTLFIVGGDDTLVLALNQRALREVQAPRHLAVIPGASHLFEELGALEQVADLAADWFARYLVQSPDVH